MLISLTQAYAYYVTYYFKSKYLLKLKSIKGVMIPPISVWNTNKLTW